MSTHFDFQILVRPNIQALKPYQSARQDFNDGLLLDANENSWGDPTQSNQQLNRYPSPTHPELRKKMARWRGVEAQNIFVGVRRDESVEHILRIFCEPGNY